VPPSSDGDTADGEENLMPDPRADDAVRQLMRGGMSRRAFLSRAAALGMTGGAIASVLSACGGGQREAQTAEGQAAEGGGQGLGKIYTQDAAKKLNDSLTWPEVAVTEPSSEVTLTVSHAWDASFWPRQQQFDKFFMERHPNIKITAENTPFADYLQKYLTQVAGGTAPDVMYCQFAWAQNFIQRGLFLPVDDYIAKQSDFDLEDFTKSSLVYYESGGQLFGVAYDCGPIMLFYNKDIFDKGGVEYPTSSWTMDDMREAIIKLTSGSGREKVFGLYDIPYPGGDFTPTYLAPFGGRFVDDAENQAVLDQPESVEAAKWWMDLYLENKAMPSPSDEQAIGEDLNAFTVGRAAMSGQGSWATPGLLEQADFKWAIADWPKGPEAQSTAAVGSCYAIVEQSPNKDAAWIYLNEYLSTAGQTFMWASTGRGSPARNSAWDAYLESEFAPEGTELVQKALNTYGTSEGVLRQPSTPEVANTVEPIWDRVVSGKLTVEEGCAEVTEKLGPVLAKNSG
jgi:multiple sugar transport system substrate-binding protein